jgi:ribonuclease-3
LIAHSPILQQLVELEKLTGVQFRHIRLLAKAFTHSSMQYSSLVGGNYEKLEHLGDAVLQFLASDFVYRKFPTLHEGHLSFLRTTLVQNKQLADLCKQLGFDQYIRTETTEVGVKILADVIESYLAALLLDKGLDYCQRFLEVCLFPKLLEIVEKSTVDDTNTQLQKAVARLCRQQHLEHEGPHYRYMINIALLCYICTITTDKLVRLATRHLQVYYMYLLS